jgi:sugar lactone lactonase YvrE
MLAACSGGQNAIPAPPSNTTNERGISVTLKIHIPKPHSHRRMRAARPNYISPATQAMTLAISGPTKLNEVVALTPTSSGCSNDPTGTTCQLTFVLAACATNNCYLATVATYDAVSCSSTCTIPPSANELSAAQNVPFTIYTGKANVVNLVLGGVPASVEVTPLHPGYLQGDAHRLQIWGPTPQKLTIVALDADGNAIVGAGAPTVSASTSGKTLNVTGPATNAPNTVVLQAATTSSSSSSSSTSGLPVVTPGQVNLSIGVTPPADSGASAISTNVPVAIAHSAVYVGFDTGRLFDEIGVYYDGNTTSTPNRLISGKGSRLQDVDQFTVDANGTLYVTTEFPTSSSSTSSSAGQVLEFQAGAGGNKIITQPNVTIFGPKTQLSTPFGIAVGPNGNLYVTNSGANTVVIFSQGASGNVAPIATIAGGLNVPECDALDSAGTLYVANFAAAASSSSGSAGSVTEYPAGSSGTVLPATINGPNPSFKSPTCVAVDGSGTLYVADETPSITKFAPGASGNAIPEARIQGPLTFLPGIPYALAVDAAGTIYAGGSSNDVVEYSPDANGNASPIGAIPTSFNVFALYAVPAPALNVVTP